MAKNKKVTEKKAPKKKPAKKALGRISVLSAEDLSRFSGGAAATCPAKEQEC